MPFLPVPLVDPPCTQHPGIEFLSLDYRFDYDTPLGPTHDAGTWEREVDDSCSVSICIDVPGAFGDPCVTLQTACLQATVSAVGLDLGEGRFGGAFLVTGRVEESGWYRFGRGLDYLSTEMHLIVGDDTSCLEPTGTAMWTDHWGNPNQQVAYRWLEAGEFQVSVAIPEPITTHFDACQFNNGRLFSMSSASARWAHPLHLHQLLADWGSCGNHDLDGDGVVGSGDLGLLFLAW